MTPLKYTLPSSCSLFGSPIFLFALPQPQGCSLDNLLVYPLHLVRVEACSVRCGEVRRLKTLHCSCDMYILCAHVCADGCLCVMCLSLCVCVCVYVCVCVCVCACVCVSV